LASFAHTLQTHKKNHGKIPKHISAFLSFIGRRNISQLNDWLTFNDENPASLPG
jgi:hypothetical protein